MSIAARRKTSSLDDALDVVQDAFVRLLGLGRDRLVTLEREQPAAYLARTITNLARDHARHAIRQSTAGHVPAEDVTIVGVDLERQLVARDDLHRLEIAMTTWKPKTRAIYLAHRVDGLTYREIARRWGMSIGGVEKQMSRAIAAVDAVLRRD